MLHGGSASIRSPLSPAVLNEPSSPVDADESLSRYEVWLAERELLSAAASVRDLSGARTRAGYDAAWMRLLIALCNLPLAERPAEVERVIEALRMAHLLRSRGNLAGDAAPDTPPTP